MKQQNFKRLLTLEKKFSKSYFLNTKNKNTRFLGSKNGIEEKDLYSALCLNVSKEEYLALKLNSYLNSDLQFYVVIDTRCSGMYKNTYAIITTKKTELKIEDFISQFNLNYITVKNKISNLMFEDTLLVQNFNFDYFMKTGTKANISKENFCFLN